MTVKPGHSTCIMNSLSQHDMKIIQMRGKEVQPSETIGGERRNDRRYDIQLQLRWKLVRRRRTIDSGTGNTIDMSSGGILFEAGADLPSGLNVELSIAWPMLLRGVAPMQLVVTGRIVRSRDGWAAIRTVTHEFRTAGFPMGYRGGLTNESKTPGMLIHMENQLATSGIG
jgi:PilZ domain